MIREEFTTVQSNVNVRGKQLRDMEVNILQLQKDVTLLTATKVDKDSFKEFKTLSENNLMAFKENLENNTNHFAMVENFIEKYIPVRIQSQISESLHKVLPERECKQLQKYERIRFRDLHATILDDDGIPDLISQLKQIRY